VIRQIGADRLPELMLLLIDDVAYLHWDELRWRPLPEGIQNHEEWWLRLRLARAGRAIPTFEGVDGHPFSVATPDSALEQLHRIDGNLMGQIGAPAEIVNPATRTRFLFSSLLEEAVRSSQLEGAVTTRKQAQDIIRSGRKPMTRDERMVMNNFMAMEFVGQHRHEELTIELILEIHRIVTEGTLDNSDAAGRFQRPEEVRVGVWDDANDVKLHNPPPAEELPERLERLCAFANETGGPFVHPVVRSVILHFWLAYDHPFEDGNGRTARALFYWSMLHHQYWLVEFLSISKILREAPIAYGRAFLYSETDRNDLTYFLIHQLEVIARAIDALNKYIATKAAEIREIEQLAQDADLNHRQLSLLTHAMRNPGFIYTYKSHATSHRVVRQTARTDLLDLVDRGLLLMLHDGHQNLFLAPDDLTDKLKGLRTS
jgi:Fic family protein